MKRVVFLHGYGANKEDLMPLGPILKSDETQSFHFIDAPGTLDFGYNARAWFEITSKHFEALNSSNGDALFENYIPPELEEVLDFIALEINKFYTHGEDELALAGFSQGSMCALHFYRKYYHGFQFNSLALLSCHLIGLGVLKEEYSKLPIIPIFQSHGKSDQVLKFEQGQRVKDFLNEYNFPCDFIEFDGGHEIPAKVISGLKSFLSR